MMPPCFLEVPGEYPTLALWDLRTNKLPYFKAERGLLRLRESCSTCSDSCKPPSQMPGGFLHRLYDPLLVGHRQEHHNDDLFVFPYVFLWSMCLRSLKGIKDLSLIILLETGLAHNKWSLDFWRRKRQGRSC